MKLQQGLRQLNRPIERRLAALIYPEGTQPADFLAPPGEDALLRPDSPAWRVFGNPVALLVGGIAAVLLELAEPRVRTGVWEHTSFRDRPLQRLQRTGHAAMMTAFGARSRAQSMIARINAGHERVQGRTPDGIPYRANDAELLAWVHATAAFGFLQGYVRCVRDLPQAERDRFYLDCQPGARLYGVVSPPASEQDVETLFGQMTPRLEPSPIVLEFLAIMRGLALMPSPLRGLQPLLLAAAVQTLPADIRERLRLTGDEWRVSPWGWRLLRLLGRAADRLTLPILPPQLALRRLGLPAR